MGRGSNKQHKDNNEAQMPQTPGKDLAAAGDDLEFAQELGDRYELETTSGFGVTGVHRNGEDET